MVICFTLSFSNAFADGICDQFTKIPPSKQNQYILSIVDLKLSKWPQNIKLKSMMSDSERINMVFKDTKNKIHLACKSNNEFEAGMALGEDLAIYKMTLLKLK